MEMDSGNTYGGAVECEIDTPESGAEGIGEPWSSLVVKGVSFAENVGWDGC